MTFLDLFAGIGGFRRGLERSGHICIGHVEIDKYANKSYMAMYGLETCPYEEFSGPAFYRMCRTEVRDGCDGRTCRGEWYAEDIRQLTAGAIPKAEIWTFGFPCTDISVSGRMAGIHGERSGLFFVVTGLLKSTAAEDKPGYLIIENVKHLISCERGRAFTTVLFELWQAGYDCEWEVVNSKNFGVPQNRERVYIVGYHGRGRRRKIFPVARANTASVKRLVDGRQGMRIYDTKGISVTLTANGGGFAGRTGLYAVPLELKQNERHRNEECQQYISFIDLSRDSRLTENARSIMAKQYAGITNHKGETSGVFICNGDPGDTETKGLYCRIRRLTPRECWRLQAFEDFLFDRAKEAGISDTQLYKQAGNAVTVNVVYEIGMRLAGGEAAHDCV